MIFRVDEPLAGAVDDGATATPAAAFAARAGQAGVRCSVVARDRVRLVAHKDAPRPAMEEAVRRLGRL